MKKVTFEQEIDIWLIFWGITALIFVIMWCVVNFKNNPKNK